MKWLELLVASAGEVVWASLLKFADSPLDWLLIGGMIAFSFILLIRVYREIPVAIAYTIFVGIGTVGTYAVSILFFKEAFNAWQLLFLALLLGGIAGLKLTTKEEA